MDDCNICEMIFELFSKSITSLTSVHFNVLLHIIQPASLFTITNIK